MSSILYRSASLTPGIGRTVYGRVVPYGVTVTIADGVPFKERFAYGAFDRSIRERGHKIMLLAQHDRRRFPVGKASELREQPDGLHASFEIANTTTGNDLLELIKTGLVSNFSVGFVSVRDRLERGVVVRTEASLREVSVVSEPAYPGAEIVGVRSQFVVPRGLAERRLKLIALQGDS